MDAGVSGPWHVDIHAPSRVAGATGDDRLLGLRQRAVGLCDLHPWDIDIGGVGLSKPARPCTA